MELDNVFLSRGKINFMGMVSFSLIMMYKREVPTALFLLIVGHLIDIGPGILFIYLFIVSHLHNDKSIAHQPKGLMRSIDNIKWAPLCSQIEIVHSHSFS